MNSRPIPGYELFYIVTDDGRVYSLRKRLFLAAAPTSRGYLSVNLYDGKRSSSHTVHSLVALAFIGPRPDGKQVNHIDGDKQNNAPSNLEYVTQSENMRHAFDTGLYVPKRGEEHCNAKLTSRQVVSIRRIARWRSRYINRPRFASNRAMARKFGVDEATIRGVVDGDTYTVVTMPVRRALAKK